MQGGHESREQELMDRECSPQRSPCLASKLSTPRQEGHYLLSSKLNEELKFNALEIERICGFSDIVCTHYLSLCLQLNIGP